MQLANYKLKYTPSNKKGHVIAKSRINSTHKWVEYSLDIHDMQKLLVSTKSINEKYTLMDLLEIAERKKTWHYRQKNFNVSVASRLLQAVLSAPYTAVKMAIN